MLLIKSKNQLAIIFFKFSLYFLSLLNCEVVLILLLSEFRSELDKASGWVRRYFSRAGLFLFIPILSSIYLSTFAYIYSVEVIWTICYSVIPSEFLILVSISLKIPEQIPEMSILLVFFIFSLIFCIFYYAIRKLKSSLLSLP